MTWTLGERNSVSRRVIFPSSAAGMPSTISGYPRVGGIAAGAAVRVRRMHPSHTIHYMAVLLCEKSGRVRISPSGKRGPNPALGRDVNPNGYIGNLLPQTA
jgi:hypothetical protein